MSTRYELLGTTISGLSVLQRHPFRDSRGYFERLFCSKELQALVRDRKICQINHTSTAIRGSVRGLHFQHPPHAEIKIVSCLVGEVFDVAVDMRHNSPTFLQWHAEVLSSANHKTFVIPEGFAHGFQTLSDNCEMLYLHTEAYQPGAEDGLNSQDPQVAIKWPLPVSELSPRDASLPMLDSGFRGIEL